MYALLKRAARAVFVEDLRLQRDERGVRLVLQSHAGPVVDPAERLRRRHAERARAEIELIRKELAGVFNGMPGARRALPHLAYIDAELAAHGLAMLDSVALNLMKHALQELENAVINWSPSGLATLRSKLAVAVRERERRDSYEPEVRLSRAMLPEPEVVESPDAADGDDSDEAALLAAYGQVAAQPEQA